MADRAREIHLEKIRKTEEEITRAGKIHKRDLQKSLKRLKRELVEYDRLKGA